MKTQTDRTEIFATMPVPRAIASLAIPTIMSQVITLIYNLADTFFVGHTGDPAQVAALTLVFPIFMLLTGIGNLFGIGANSKISRCLGVGDHEGAKRTCSFSFWGGIAVTVVLVVIFSLFCDPILRIMGASDQTLGHARDYVFWVIIIGGIPTEASLLLAHMLRGEGGAKAASTGMMVGGLLNIILDPIFIFPMGMGVGGAGLATMLSNVVCLLYYIIVLKKQKGGSVISVRPKDFTLQGSGEVLLVGFPAAMIIVLGGTANMILTRLLAGYGDLAVAAFGVTQKFGTITMNISVGLTQGIMPLIGYNQGAGNHERVKAVCRCSFLILLCFVLVFIGVYQSVPDFLLRLFVSDPDTVALGVTFLRRWSFTIPGMTFVFLFNSIFQAMGKWKQSLLLSVLRQGFIFIPTMLILNAVMGMYGPIWAQPFADTLSLGIAYVLYAKLMKEEKARLEG